MVKFSAKVVVGQVCSFRSVLNQGTYFLLFLLLDNIGAKPSRSLTRLLVEANGLFIYIQKETLIPTVKLKSFA